MHEFGCETKWSPHACELKWQELNGQDASGNSLQEEGNGASDSQDGQEGGNKDGSDGEFYEYGDAGAVMASPEQFHQQQPQIRGAIQRLRQRGTQYVRRKSSSTTTKSKHGSQGQTQNHDTVVPDHFSETEARRFTNVIKVEISSPLLPSQTISNQIQIQQQHHIQNLQMKQKDRGTGNTGGWKSGSGGGREGGENTAGGNGNGGKKGDRRRGNVYGQRQQWTIRPH